MTGAMDDTDWLAAKFEENRTRLQGVARKLLGSPGEADDAVQEAWLRLSQSRAGEIEDLGRWLTTVVARVCLDMLRSRSSRREDSLEVEPRSAAGRPAGRPDPEAELVLADSVGQALSVVLESLSPAERVAFVLHDVLGLPFEEIGPIVGRAPEAARQLASRARRRIQGAPAEGGPDSPRRREVVSAFLAASRDGDFEALVAVLAPDVVLRVDDAALRTAAANRWGPALSSETRGAAAVAAAFKGRAQGARPALIDGQPGAAWVVGGQTRSAFVFTVRGGVITEIELAMAPERLAELHIQVEARPG